MWIVFTGGRDGTDIFFLFCPAAYLKQYLFRVKGRFYSNPRPEHLDVFLFRGFACLFWDVFVCFFCSVVFV